MRNISHFILFAILVLLTSCMHVGKEDRIGYHIKGEKRISKMIGMDGLPIEKVQNEYYIVSKNKKSAVVIGYVAYPTGAISLYLVRNSHVKSEQAFPVDDSMEIELLTHVMDEIKRSNNNYNVKDMQISLMTCGVANLNISKKYWDKKQFKILWLQQPLFKRFHEILRRYGYDIYDITHNDFYPVTASMIRNYHILPDSCSLNSLAIDGIVILKCKKVNRKTEYQTATFSSRQEWATSLTTRMSVRML